MQSAEVRFSVIIAEPRECGASYIPLPRASRGAETSQFLPLLLFSTKNDSAVQRRIVFCFAIFYSISFVKFFVGRCSGALGTSGHRVFSRRTFSRRHSHRSIGSSHQCAGDFRGRPFCTRHSHRSVELFASSPFVSGLCRRSPDFGAGQSSQPRSIRRSSPNSFSSCQVRRSFP